MSEQLKRALRRTNFDDLNDKDYTIVKSKVPYNLDSSKTIVSGDKINPDTSKTVVSGEKVNPDTSYKRIKGNGIGKEVGEDITKVAGKGIGKEVGEDIIKVAGKGMTKISHAIKGTGKVAAISAALSAAGNVMAGEKPDWATMGRGAAEALIPAPVDAAFGSLGNSDLYSKEDFKRLREENSRPAALEFGKRFAKALKTGKPI